MQDFYNFFLSLPNDPGVIIVLMTLSLFIAIFQSFIIVGALELELQPKWLLFALNPSLVALGWSIHGSLAFFIFMLLFLSIFIVGAIGMYQTNQKTDKNDLAELKRFYDKYQIKNSPKANKSLLFLLIIIVLFFSIMATPLFFLFMALFFFFKSNQKDKFTKYQAILPTSKVRSVAMGLAELQGRLIMIEPLMTPIEDKECIGFRYVIDDISTDSDGKERFSNQLDETKFNPFYLADETGQIKVNPENLSFVLYGHHAQYRNNGKRYTLYVATPQQRVLMIGKVSLENNTPILEYENIKKVFGIAPLKKVSNFNKLRPLRNSLLLYFFGFMILVIYLLLIPIYIKNERVILDFDITHINWQNFLSTINF